jgi:hypothetical protein
LGENLKNYKYVIKNIQEHTQGYKNILKIIQGIFKKRRCPERVLEIGLA